jgi:hypothetical protein
MVELLIQAGSPVNAQNFMGLTPLICAAQATDLQSAALLIHAGATLNLRSANGFSPIIWAITAKFPNHEMIQLLLNACITPINKAVTTETEAKTSETETETEGKTEGGEEGEESGETGLPKGVELQRELFEDFKCYKLGQLLLNLKITVKDFLTKYENTQRAVGKEVTRPPAYLIHRKIVETLGHVTGVVIEAGGAQEMKPKYLTTVTSSVGLYAALLSHLQAQLIPESLFYQYKLPTATSTPQEAVMNAPLIEQAHLSILMTAATGETKEPLLCTASHQPNVFHCTRYSEYRMLIREPMVALFSACVPTDEALTLITTQKQNLLFVLGIGADYWARNIQEVSSRRQPSSPPPLEMKLVRSTSSAHIAPYFLDQTSAGPSTRIETVTSLQPLSSNHTLVMIWPMCNMISTSSRELVEKDEELLLSYAGKTIVLIGDVNYNPLNRPPTVRGHLLEKYECIETVALPNWREFENTVTVWSRLD